MSTPATRNTDVSTGGSTEDAQTVRIATRGNSVRGTAGRGSGTMTGGAVLPVAGEHVPILHLTALLSAPTGDVPKVLKGVTLEDQLSQATEIYGFLITPSLSLPRLNEGAKIYADLVNVPKTSLVIFFIAWKWDLAP